MVQRVRFSRRIAVGMLALLALGAVTFSAAQENSRRGRKYKPPPPTSKVVVTVVRASSGRPVENASVIFHPLEDGKNAGNMELKTNDDGKAMIDLLEIGSDVRVQVIAPGFQTYGQDYKVEKNQMAIEIALNPPGKQYSIYKKDEGRVAPGTAQQKAKDGTAPEAPKTPPADGSKPQGTQPQ